MTGRGGMNGLVVSEGGRPSRVDVFSPGQARSYLRLRLGAAADTDPAALRAVVDRRGGLTLALAMICARAAAVPLSAVADELRRDSGLGPFAVAGTPHDLPPACSAG
uniref:hypothetical protein n=1 Tax=Paractinoplanes polyasparticus TaxID=2856853 RepID=UPI001C863E4E|nr:hypothetical protein [Actinoplanes polyasparticus]